MVQILHTGKKVIKARAQMRCDTGDVTLLQTRTKLRLSRPAVLNLWVLTCWQTYLQKYLHYDSQQ